MIAILKPGTTTEKRDNLISWFKAKGLDVHLSVGEYKTVLGLIGDTSQIDEFLLESLDIIDSVKRVSEPYKSAGRMFHPDDSVISAGDVPIGGGSLKLIAGPCSVESAEQINGIAAEVKRAGASILRGGAFKPRTSPYDFQGLEAEGLTLLLEAKKLTGMPIISEVMSTSHLHLFADVDVIQVGARNMQNFDLLKELGRSNKPVLLKRGLASTLKELLMSAEYILSGGNGKIILCERGVRTFENFTRNTLDLSAVPVLKELTHLPVVVDPSHAVGISRMVRPLSLAAAAVGADGIMIEVHNDPANALCDGAQSITPAAFAELALAVNRVREVIA